MKVIARAGFGAELGRLLGAFPAVAILGPRQCGKTTLVRDFLARRARGGAARAATFDLDRPSDLERLARNPEEDLGLLQTQRGFIAVDEIQRLPQLYSVLRPLLDQPSRRARYILLGSASPALVRGVSESLAGRIAFLDLTPFLAAEVGAASGARRARLLARGGFPPSFLARSDQISMDWRDSHVRALLERDLPALGLDLPAVTLRRLWTMLAHLSGGILKVSDLAASLGVSHPTALRYIDVLEGLFVVRRLPPYFANVGKRLVKAPKIYVRDTGLLHLLLGIGDHEALLSHPKAGLSWEGWVIEQVLGALRLVGCKAEPFYWHTHAGAEVDLLLRIADKFYPIEIKLGRPERSFRGLVECMKDLDLPRGFVIHAGDGAFPMGDKVWALPARLLTDPPALLRALETPQSLAG